MTTDYTDKRLYSFHHEYSWLNIKLAMGNNSVILNNGKEIFVIDIILYSECILCQE